MPNWLIVGLGNPGSRYASTRHNIGFMIVEAFSARFCITLTKKSFQSRYGRGSVSGREVVLVKPLTYMNNSGEAVRGFMRNFGSDIRLVVLHDDLDSPLGRLRIRVGGGAGGHRGVASVIDHLGYNDFIRVKVGIGRDSRIPVEKYVLSRFGKDEYKIIEESVFNAAEAVELIITDGVQAAMNMCNRSQSLVDRKQKK